MEIEPRHIVLLLLFHSKDNSIIGKTKLQKEIYFLDCKENLNLRFKAHYYGPYSNVVENGIDELYGAGFLDIDINYLGQEQNTGFEVKKYFYKLTQNGIELAKIIDEQQREISDKIRSFKEKLYNLDDPDYLQLSVAAKAHFILKTEEKPMSRDDIKKKAKEFNWNINEEMIDSAAKLLEKLGLIHKAV